MKTSTEQITRIMREYNKTGLLCEIDLHALVTIAYVEGSVNAYREAQTMIDNLCTVGKLPSAALHHKGVPQAATVVNG